MAYERYRHALMQELEKRESPMQMQPMMNTPIMTSQPPQQHQQHAALSQNMETIL